MYNDFTSMEKQRRQARTRPPSFKMEIPGNEQKKHEVSDKMQKIRGSLVNTLNKPVNNCDIIDAALDFWIKSHVSDQDAHLLPGVSSIMAICFTIYWGGGIEMSFLYMRYLIY